ncbi:hypothetical protein C7974DRAFT_383492 [Boeremia exigua]|uniref:uncharacterized protein n=1 Tax=Boeremia exigua TaxID=749465 RepID=UPI001E8D3BFF|nr:uncharacterized protein C7974DRAFT_383492 [Boeremia exigua]KAH6644413.1 hypothetical protein C7974DRAFT_383492 [Boeremia exigua]
MIVTIDDYRGADSEDGPGKSEQIKDEDDDTKFTVSMAGHLKLKLQALNSMLICTPSDRHDQLQFDDVAAGVPPRTYVNGSEKVYFLVRDLTWPSKIPDIYMNAYSEVVRSCPFTNRYIRRPSRNRKLRCYGPTYTSFAPTFSSIRALLPHIDALCNTSLNDFFEKADEKVKPFPFMNLPAELRLQVYDCLVPSEAFVRVRTKKSHRVDQRFPMCLSIMRVSRTLCEETTRHFFDKPCLLIEACERPRYHEDNPSFSAHTAMDYAALVTSVSAEVRRKFTRLEIQIVLGVPSVEQELSRDRLRDTPLRQICSALPNLEVVLISFQRREQCSELINYDPPPWRERRTYVNSQSRTLDWIDVQLPDEGPRVAWDLMYFGGQMDDAARLRSAIMSERMMRGLIEKEGSLELEQSTTATREDLQRWSATKELVLDALGRR